MWGYYKNSLLNIDILQLKMLEAVTDWRLRLSQMNTAASTPNVTIFFLSTISPTTPQIRPGSHN